MGLPVCIFAKPPVPGEVKTRLIPVLGDMGAAELAAAMLQDVWQVVESCPDMRPVLASTKYGDFPVPGAPAEVWLQGEGDLGQRIEHILERALQNASAAIAIGADTPALMPSHLAAALDGLQSYDAVIGPALDGGFYLLGVRKFKPGLFSTLPWSTSETCEAMKTRMGQSRLSVAEIEPLFDVDTPGDLVLLEQYLATNRSSAPATRAWCLQNKSKLILA
jgi:uncharacterized protein